MKTTLPEAAAALSDAVTTMRAAGYMAGDTALNLAEQALTAARADCTRAGHMPPEWPGTAPAMKLPALMTGTKDDLVKWLRANRRKFHLCLYRRRRYNTARKQHEARLYTAREREFILADGRHTLHVCHALTPF